MSKRKNADVKIVNPVAGRGYTSRKCAERYVRDGRARFTADGLEFIDQNRLHVAASQRSEYDMAANTGMATLGDLANLPMSRPKIFLGVGRNTGASRSTFLATQGL